MAEVAHTAWYDQGTVSVTSGSTKISGSNTKWLTAGINPGATFRLNGWPYDYEVASVVSDTEIQLRRPYYGSNVSGAAYTIDRNFQSTLPSDLASRTAAVMGKYENYIDSDLQKITGESAYQIARRLGKTTAATEAAWIDELKAGAEYTEYKNKLAALIADEAGNHNSHYFNASMGLFTDEVSANIRNATFKGLFPGRPFIFSNIPYTYIDENDEEKSSTYSGIMRVADIDYYLRCGDSDLTTHHIVVVPDTPLYNAPMNPTNTTEGGYVGSKMRTKYLRRAEAIFKACFGENHVLKHRILLTTTVTDGKPTAGAWCDSLVDLLNELMVYGSYIHTPANDGVTIPYRYTESKSQLALFRYRPDLIVSSRSWWWLRDVVSVAFFANVNNNGNANYNNASLVGGVRPNSLSAQLSSFVLACRLREGRDILSARIADKCQSPEYSYN